MNKAGQLNAVFTMLFLATTSVSAAWKKLMKPHIVKVNEGIYGEDPSVYFRIGILGAISGYLIV